MITKKNKYYRTRAALASIRFSLNDRYDRRFGGDGYRIGLFRRLALVLDGTLLLLDWYLYSSGPRPLSSLPLGEFFRIYDGLHDFVDLCIFEYL